MGISKSTARIRRWRGESMRPSSEELHGEPYHGRMLCGVWELFFTAERLKYYKKLVSCGIQRNSTLELVLQTAGIVKLSVNMPTKWKAIEVEANGDTIEHIQYSSSGETLTIFVRQHDNVRDVKTKSSRKLGDPDFHVDFLLVYAGKYLKDDRDVASYGIERH
ncbi:hypothetical protein RJ640_013934 [Escallonia rubra]|uniref:Ubiquitin-like domain-containing protein n=1 Tax=Escallonia rubra TaxID=112253 RepID=A0AA88R1U8_9ASTE|nr:hypothetical protein RJ640_013934 [Escallonia rubra]